MRKKRADSMLGKKLSLSTRSIKQEQARQQWSDPSYREKQSSAVVRLRENGVLAERSRAGGLTAKGGRGRKGYYFSKKNSCNIFYQSKDGELLAYIRLENDPNVFKYGRVQFSLPYILDGKAHQYRPDIMVEFLDGTYRIIEVKMSWEFEYVEACRRITVKLLVLRKYCEEHGLTYEVWTEKELGIG